MIRSGKIFSLLTVLALATLPALAGAADAAKPKAASHAAKPVIWPVDKLTWVDAVGAPPGVKQCVLWGDPAKGPHGVFQKFPAGFKAPMHTHSSDLKTIVVSGTIIHGEVGGKETRLPPGSYLYSPHTEKHTTACDPASDCVFFMESSGKFDVIMVDEKK